MLIASTNPLILYYHDGYLRVTLSEYDKFSTERVKHLTNTHIADSIIEKVNEEKGDNTTAQELREAHIWSFERFHKHLMEIGKITDPEWLKNYLRPQFHKAMIHLVKMTSTYYWKQSNVYGLYGLDFMLDDDLNLWFIEANPNPLIAALTGFLRELLDSMVRSMFEIEYGLYRSRMKRVYEVIQNIYKKEKADEQINYEHYKEEYQKASSNRFESQFKPSKFNTFTLIMVEGKKTKTAYFENFNSDCIFD